ncbi:hypothetical protein [Paracidovorax oryzae]|uniref:hypothetical protein n=1 Tax=Paracidovorax oryzae TaxID=862720 RepID=UPI0035CFC583
MLEFLFRLVVETVKFAFRVLMILGGLLLPALGNAAISFFSTDADTQREEEERMSYEANEMERELANGNDDRMLQKNFRDVYGDL